ncbi:MAG: phytanoyl-CoA dioxygenase family protein [Phycisphaeraceae bacterium]
MNEIRQIPFGSRLVPFPSATLGELRHSNDIVASPAALRQRMEEDGYLLIRGLIDPAKVQRARTTVLQYMAEHEGLEPGSRPLDGVMGQYGKSVGLMGRKLITHHPDVKAVLESQELFDFYRGHFGEPARTFDYKWLRAVGHEEYTGAHYDVVYMGRGTEQLRTCWIPMGDIEIEQGVLAICEGSHSAVGFEKLRRTYGRMDVDRDRVTGWFTREPMEIAEKFGGRWKTSSFRAGDILTFGMYTMHASTTNTTDRWRLSCDVRFQPAAEPVDERWVGENPINHYAASAAQGPLKSMEVARAEWGV